MNFWDSSAIIPLLVEEQGSQNILELFQQDTGMIVWWGTSIECVSAICRLEREGAITPQITTETIKKLHELRASWREVLPSAKVKATAERLLRVHPLKPQDSQQLAAAIIINQTYQIRFVTCDKKLQVAADKEGLAT